MTLQDKKTVEKYLNLLFGRHSEEGNVFLLERLVFGDNYNAGKGNRQIAKPLQILDIVAYVEENGSTYDFSISPGIYAGNVRSYDNISGLYCFWAEFDYGTVGHKKRDLPFASKDECIRMLKNNYIRAELNPNMIMNSGHGIHCYWLVDSNLIGQQTKKQIEQVNEWLFQIGIGINRNYYNEVKSITSLMRSPYPAVNRKIASKPVDTKMIITRQNIYRFEEIRNNIAAFIIRKHKEKKVIFRKTNHGGKNRAVLRFGDVDMLEKDEAFMSWLSDSTILCYYKSDKFYFDSTSAKEAWIFKYLYMCDLDIIDIYEFCKQYMDRQYHLFRTRKTRIDRLKRIKYEIDLATKRGTFPKKIRNEHINQEALYE